MGLACYVHGCAYTKGPSCFAHTLKQRGGGGGEAKEGREGKSHSDGENFKIEEEGGTHKGVRMRVFPRGPSLVSAPRPVSPLLVGGMCVVCELVACSRPDKDPSAPLGPCREGRRRDDATSKASPTATKGRGDETYSDRRSTQPTHLYTHSEMLSVAARRAWAAAARRHSVAAAAGTAARQQPQALHPLASSSLFILHSTPPTRPLSSSSPPSQPPNHPSLAPDEVARLKQAAQAQEEEEEEEEEKGGEKRWRACKELGMRYLTCTCKGGVGGWVG